MSPPRLVRQIVTDPSFFSVSLAGQETGGKRRRSRHRAPWHRAPWLPASFSTADTLAMRVRCQRQDVCILMDSNASTPCRPCLRPPLAEHAQKSAGVKAQAPALSSGGARRASLPPAHAGLFRQSLPKACPARPGRAAQPRAPPPSRRLPASSGAGFGAKHALLSKEAWSIRTACFCFYFTGLRAVSGFCRGGPALQAPPPPAPNRDRRPGRTKEICT